MSFNQLKYLFSLNVTKTLTKQLILILFMILSFSSLAHPTSYLIKKKMGHNKGFQFLGDLQLSRESGKIISVLSLARNQGNNIRIVYSWSAEDETFGIFDEGFHIYFNEALTCILQPNSQAPLHVFHDMAKYGHSNFSIRTYGEERLCRFEGIESENFIFSHSDLGVDSITASLKSWSENSFLDPCSVRIYEPVSNSKGCSNAIFTRTSAKLWDRKTCFHAVYDRNPCALRNSVFFIEDRDIKMSRVGVSENHRLQAAAQIPVTEIIQLSCLLMLLPDVESNALFALRGQHLQIAIEPTPSESTSEQRTSTDTAPPSTCSARPKKNGATPPQLFSAIVKNLPVTHSDSQHSDFLSQLDSRHTPYVNWTYKQLRAGADLDRCQSVLSKSLSSDHVTAVLTAANTRYLWRRDFLIPEDKAKYIDCMFGACTEDEDQNAVLTKGLKYFYDCTPSDCQIIIGRTHNSKHRSQLPADFIASLWPDKAGKIPDTPQEYALAISKIWNTKPYDVLVREIAAAIPSMYVDQHEPLYLEDQVKSWLEAAASRH